MLKNIAPSLSKLTSPLVKKRLQSWDAFYKKNPNTGVHEVKADDPKRPAKAQRK